MKFKKFLSVVSVVAAIAIGVTACGSNNSTDEKKASAGDDKTIVVGATANPHAEILEEAVKPILEKDGYKLQVKVFNDYVLPNAALDEGSLDANFFQHIPYLEESVQAKGYKIEPTVKVHLEPMGLYSDKVKKVDEIKDGAVIAIPNDPTNGSRALKLLEKAGLIKVKDAAIITNKDITENKKNIEVKQMNAEQLPTILKDVDAAVINSNYAMQAKLNPVNDSIVIEDKDSPYANVIAVRTSDKDSEKIKELNKAMTDPSVKKFIEEQYKGAIIPAF